VAPNETVPKESPALFFFSSLRGPHPQHLSQKKGGGRLKVRLFLSGSEERRMSPFFEAGKREKGKKKGSTLPPNSILEKKGEKEALIVRYRNDIPPGRRGGPPLAESLPMNSSGLGEGRGERL